MYSPVMLLSCSPALTLELSQFSYLAAVTTMEAIFPVVWSLWLCGPNSVCNPCITLFASKRGLEEVLWHVTAVTWQMTWCWKTATYLYEEETLRVGEGEEDFLLLGSVWWWLSSVSWRNTYITETEWSYWACTVRGTQETGNYPQFTSWLAGIDYKRIVFFFLHGNKLMQTRWTWKERERCKLCFSHTAAGCV